MESDMSIRTLREQKQLSQERLAQVSGLSLRTIQRVEAGHRISYASLRVLAATFDVNVDSLERELYAMHNATDSNNATEEFVEIPRWIRIMNGEGLHKSMKPALSRRDAYLMEAIFLGIGIAFFVASLLIDTERTAQIMRFGAAVVLVACYLMSISSRIVDTYKLWPSAEVIAAQGFFGFGKNRK
jgi:transcriptional regulator with XRE-family HTH domain